MSLFRKLAGLLVLVLAAPLAAAGDPPSSHVHRAPAAALHLDHGRRWATTPPLRQGMNGIRKAVAEAVPTPPRALTAVEAKRLADAIRLQVDYLVANCVLAPEADAALHVLLGQMLEGAQALRRNPADEAALHGILAALNDYPAYFDHPGWQPVKAVPLH